MTCSSRSGGREFLFFTKAVPADLTRTVANDKQRNIRKKRKDENILISGSMILAGAGGSLGESSMEMI